jgi:hypothetical protein
MLLSRPKPEQKNISRSPRKFDHSSPDFIKVVNELKTGYEGTPEQLEEEIEQLTLEWAKNDEMKMMRIRCRVEKTTTEKGLTNSKEVSVEVMETTNDIYSASRNTMKHRFLVIAVSAVQVTLVSLLIVDALQVWTESTACYSRLEFGKYMILFNPFISAFVTYYLTSQMSTSSLEQIAMLRKKGFVSMIKSLNFLKLESVDEILNGGKVKSVKVLPVASVEEVGGGIHEAKLLSEALKLKGNKGLPEEGELETDMFSGSLERRIKKELSNDGDQEMTSNSEKFRSRKEQSNDGEQAATPNSEKLKSSKRRQSMSFRDSIKALEEYAVKVVEEDFRSYEEDSHDLHLYLFSALFVFAFFPFLIFYVPYFLLHNLHGEKVSLFFDVACSWLCGISVYYIVASYGTPLEMIVNMLGVLAVMEFDGIICYICKIPIGVIKITTTDDEQNLTDERNRSSQAYSIIMFAMVYLSLCYNYLVYICSGKGPDEDHYKFFWSDKTHSDI